MKRTLIVLAMLTAFSAASVSTAAASPVAGRRAASVTDWLSYYIAMFLRAHANGQVDLQAIDTDTGVILGGDADDYANGKDDRIGPDTDGDIREAGLLGPGNSLSSGAGVGDQTFRQ